MVASVKTNGTYIFTLCFDLPSRIFNIFSVFSETFLKSCQEETLEGGMGKARNTPLYLKNGLDIRRDVNNCLKSVYSGKIAF